MIRKFLNFKKKKKNRNGVLRVQLLSSANKNDILTRKCTFLSSLIAVKDKNETRYIRYLMTESK